MEQHESLTGEVTSADPRVAVLIRYLFDEDDTGDAEFEAARFKEDKAVIVLRRLDECV